MIQSLEDIEEIVITELIELTGLDRAAVCTAQSLVATRILDSLKLFELYLLLEGRFGDAMAEATADDLENVGRISSHIYNYQLASS